MNITLDAASQNPVVIKVIALNGDGIPTDNENDLSLIASVKFGNFDALFGHDLSGFQTENYAEARYRTSLKLITSVPMLAKYPARGRSAVITRYRFWGKLIIPASVSPKRTNSEELDASLLAM